MDFFLIKTTFLGCFGGEEKFVLSSLSKHKEIEG
jgi:hypothetical protein